MKILQKSDQTPENTKEPGSKRDAESFVQMRPAPCVGDMLRTMEKRIMPNLEEEPAELFSTLTLSRSNNRTNSKCRDIYVILCSVE